MKFTVRFLFPILFFIYMANPARSAECIDTDGDGWGWDGVESCLISESVTATASGVCEDADGDGWGWNGVESCLISESVAATVSGVCEDADGDGWGWNGVESCLVKEEITTADNEHGVVVGQGLVEAVSAAFSLPLQGTITRVVDGDSLVMFVSGIGEMRIRLKGIDAPELDQDFGVESKAFLSLYTWSAAEAHCTSIDIYDRYICEIFVANRNLNVWQLQAGNAWWYRRYQDEQTEASRALYSVAETVAMRFYLGLWAFPDPIAPWDWRAL